MLKTLIVDDDIFIYSHFKKLIDWEGEGFQLCDAAGNGLEALRIIDRERPEIVITDMNLPGLNGVALIRHIQQSYPGIKVIALSAYDDFEYVKDSLKLGAVDYILKHTLTPELLRGLLRSVKQTISHEAAANEADQRLMEQLKTGKTLLIQKLVHELVKEGSDDGETIRQKLSDLGLELGMRNLVVVAGAIDDYPALREKFSHNEMNDLVNSLLEISGEILRDSEKSLIAALGDGKFVIIFSFEQLHSSQDIFNQVLTALNRIKTTVKRYLNITACFATDGICENIMDVHKYYQKSERLLSKKFYLGKDQIFNSPVTVKLAYDQPILEIRDEKIIAELVKRLERDQLVSYIDQIFEKLQHVQPHLSAAKLTFFSLLHLANKIARDCGIDNSLIYGAMRDPYQDLDKLGTVLEVKNWILAIYEKLIDSLKIFRLHPAGNAVTRKAMEYIYKNYKKDISLGDIADYAGVNSSYLSRKFKNELGQGVIEHLNAVRMSHAKALMEEGCKKVKEVAGEAGFNNYNYFFKVFKDSEGMTPLEYEKRANSSSRLAKPGGNQTVVDMAENRRKLMISEGFVFKNPLVAQRADPWIYKHTDGYYYFSASVPEYDRIELRRATTIDGLSAAAPVVVWGKHAQGAMSQYIWAPELHYLNDRWYIYFAAATIGVDSSHRIYVLENASSNPLSGVWEEKGQIKTNWESFALDATTFAHRGMDYLVWAQRDPEIRGNSNLYIAVMRNPWTIEGEQVMLSKPEYPWEIIGFWVNEGPAVLKKNGRIFISYSASATDANYCMGLLTAPDGSELLNPQSWQKSVVPVFQSNDAAGQYGPGHNSFTVSPNGSHDILVYHARNYREIDGDPLFDPNRHTRVQRLGWNPDGTPDFGTPVPDSRSRLNGSVGGSIGAR